MTGHTRANGFCLQRCFLAVFWLRKGLPSPARNLKRNHLSTSRGSEFPEFRKFRKNLPGIYQFAVENEWLENFHALIISRVLGYYCSFRFFSFRLLMPTMMVLDPGLHQHFYHFGVEHCDVHFRGEGVLDNTGFFGGLVRVHGSWLMMSGKSEWMMIIYNAGTIEYVSLCFLPFEIYIYKIALFAKIHAVSTVFGAFDCYISMCFFSLDHLTYPVPIHTYPIPIPYLSQYVSPVFWTCKKTMGSFGWSAPLDDDFEAMKLAKPDLDSMLLESGSQPNWVDFSQQKKVGWLAWGWQETNETWRFIRI